MHLSELVVALQNAKSPNRKLDAEIAILAGFQRVVVKVKDTGLPSGKKRIWLNPNGQPGNVPAYTRLVDSAIEFSQFAAPENVGGCSWEKDRGTARINSGPYVTAANPAIALCVAAVQILWVRGGA